MSNIHGLYTKKEQDSSDDDDDDGTNNRYVGGIDARGGGSGLAVQPNDRDAVFGRATKSNNYNNEQNQQRRVITMYRNGFIVDDGPFRRLDDDANSEFLRALAQGKTPREFLSNTNSNHQEDDVIVGLLDHREKDYVEEFRTFHGVGTALGTTTTTPATGSATASGVIDPTTLSTTFAPPPTATTSATTTTIAIRLMHPSQGRKIITVPITCTIWDLIVTHLLNDESTTTASTGPFTLVTGFPPRTLTDFSQTIEQAGLIGAQVIQKEYK